MANDTRLVVLVHGWSVRSTETYGQLAQRLETEAQRDAGLRLDVRNIWLSKYVSFDDDVRMEDLSRAFEAAIRRELGAELDKGRRFACITHSTGGPVARDWWDRYYVSKTGRSDSPMSHLIMLAAPNFGSALAQLGKGKLSRIRTWFQGVEPGTRVLDWLELGSPEAWALNRRWFDYPDTTQGPGAVFLFSLTGQTIERKFYDHVNSYTGELGSDGVVRTASANLNATYVRLEQEKPRRAAFGGDAQYEAPALAPAGEPRQSRRTAFRLIEGVAHSGEDKGILSSIRAQGGDHPTVKAILRCLKVGTAAEYAQLCAEFEQETAAVQESELREKEEILGPDRWFIHDPYAMVLFRVEDGSGFPVEKFDLVLTAGERSDPNLLPEGFFKDRQGNPKHRGTVAYYLNHALMHGTDELRNPAKPREVLRPKRAGAGALGLRLNPHQQSRLVHYLPASLSATTQTLEQVVRPHQTTMVDIVLRRVVREGVYRLTTDRAEKDFTRDPEGPALE